MSKYKIGDKVRIVKEKRGRYWNYEGKMDKWLGKTMTVLDFHEEGGYIMKGDSRECPTNFTKNRGWIWYDHMIEGLANTQEIHITVKGDETHAVLKENGKVIKHSVAKCHPEDEFDFEIGSKMAFERLFKHEFKIGDYAVLKTDKIESKLKIGSFVKILKVKSIVADVSGYHEIFKDEETRGVCLTDLEPANITDAEYEAQFKKNYNGKVVCVDKTVNKFYTEGKIYQFEDGFLKDDDGSKLPFKPISSFDEWKKYSSAKWLEIVED